MAAAAEWSVLDVAAWLRKEASVDDFEDDAEPTFAAFEAKGVTGTRLLALDDNALRGEVGIKNKGLRKHLLELVSRLGQQPLYVATLRSAPMPIACRLFSMRAVHIHSFVMRNGNMFGPR